MELTKNQIKRGIIISVSISVIAIVLVVLLTQDDFSYQVFNRLDTTYLLIAIYITIIFWILRSVKLKVLTSSLGGDVSFSRIFSIYLASAFVAHVTPSSSGGLPFVIYFIHREGLPLGKSTALTVLDSMLNLVFYMVAAPILLLIWGEFLSLGPVITRFFYIALSLVTAFIIFSLVLIFNAHLAITFVQWLTGLDIMRRLFTAEKLEKFTGFAKKEVKYFNEGMDYLVSRKKDLLLVLVFTILYWLFYLSLAPVLLKGLGLNFAIPPVVLAQLVFNFIQPIIPTPGGSGGAELSFAYLFKFMVPNYMLGIFVALWRFFIFYTSLIVGSIFFVRLVQGTDFLGNGESIKSEN